MTSTTLSITPEQLTHWADECLSINHLNTLVQREIAANSLVRAADLSERARSRAWNMLNEMFVAGAAKPKGYCDAGTVPEADNWAPFSVGIDPPMTLQPPIPVLRVFDASLAKQFYLDWLGFALDWEHQLEGNAPRYFQVSRGAAVLHLSEHYGDCCPGAKVFIHTDDVESLHRELSERPNPNMHPGIVLAPWNAKVMEVTDPFGNRLCFNQLLASDA